MEVTGTGIRQNAANDEELEGRMVSMKQPGFYLEERPSAFSKQGDPLEILNDSIPKTTFRPVLRKLEKAGRKSNAGCKRCDAVMMLKILLLRIRDRPGGPFADDN